MYKYTLEKYRGPASRHTCPYCGHKRQFTCYVDTETGKYLSPWVGKCNREINCGIHYTPAEYFADRPELGKPVLYSPPASGAEPPSPPKLPGYINRSYVTRSTGRKNHLTDHLVKFFDHEKVQRVVAKYDIGGTNDLRTIFWQQDIDGLVRTGQVIRYDPKSGHRVKDQPGDLDWTHSMLQRRKELPEDFNLRQCLFGEHLFSKYPDKVIVLVESAKSATVCSALLPDFIWCATNGKAGFSVERCRALKGRNVVVIPDLDAHEEWAAKASHIAREVGCEIYVSDFLWRLGTAEQRLSGYDIADYIIDELKKGALAKEVARKIDDAIGHFYIPKRLSDLIVGCLKEPFKTKP